MDTSAGDVIRGNSIDTVASKREGFLRDRPESPSSRVSVSRHSIYQGRKAEDITIGSNQIEIRRRKSIGSPIKATLNNHGMRDMLCSPKKNRGIPSRGTSADSNNNANNSREIDENEVPAWCQEDRNAFIVHEKISEHDAPIHTSPSTVVESVNVLRIRREM